MAGSTTQLAFDILARDKASRTIAKIGDTSSRTGGKLTLLQKAGKLAAVGLTAATVAGAGFLYNVGSPYVASLNKIEALTGASNAQMQRAAGYLESNAGGYAKLGQTTGDAAAGVVELSKSGLSLNRSLKSVHATLVLAKAGELDVAQASEFVANTLNTFSLSASEAEHVANSLANAANISSADVVDLAESFKYVAPIAAKAGIDVDGVSAMLAELANQGIKGSQAGTSLRQMLIRLQSPTENAAGLLEEMGVHIFDATGKMRPFRSVLGELSKGFDGLTGKERAHALKSIFGLNALTAAQVILKGNTDQLDEYTRGVKRAGAANKLAEANSKGLAGTFAMIRSGAVSTGQTLYRKYSPIADKAIRQVIGYLEEHRDEIKQNARAVSAELLPVLQDLVSVGGDVAQTVGDIAGPLGGQLLPAIKETAEAVGGAVGWIADLPGPVKSIGVEAALAALVLPRLVAGVSAVTGAVSLGTTAVRVYSLELRDADRRATLMAAGMAKLSAMARTAAGVGGLVALTESLGETNDALSRTEQAAGLAAVGFSVGGPWGGAIGGTVGIFKGLWDTLTSTGDVLTRQKKPVADYAATLNEITGAAEAATRNVARLDLQQRGAFKAANQLGISNRDLVDYVLGNEAAIKRVNTAMAASSDETRVYVDALGQWHQETIKGGAAAQALKGALDQAGYSLQKDVEKTRAAALVNEKLSDVYDGLSKKKILVRIRQIGGEVSLGQLRKLARQVKLTPKDVRIIARANNLNLTRRQVLNLAGALDKTAPAARRAGKGLEGVGKAKPNLSAFVRGIDSFLAGGKRSADRGSKSVARALSFGTKGAKPQFGGFNASLTRGIATARGTASSGGSQIGNALGSGTYAGIGAWAGPIASRAAAVVRQAITAAKNAGEIRSPSRKTRREVGQELGKGIGLGLDDTLPRIERSARKTTHKVLSTVAKDRIKIGAAGARLIRELAHGVGRGERDLKKVLDRVDKYVDKWHDKVDEKTNAKSAFVGGFQGFTTSVFNADYTTARTVKSVNPLTGEETETQRALTAEDVLRQQQAEESKAKQLELDVAQLRRMKISPALLQQLSDNGDTETIHALAGGSAAVISRLNKSQANTVTALKQTGLGVASDLGYDKNIAEARRNERTAAALAKALRKELREHHENTQIHLHLEGQTIVTTVKAYKRKHGNKPTGIG